MKFTDGVKISLSVDSFEVKAHATVAVIKSIMFQHS